MYKNCLTIPITYTLRNNGREHWLTSFPLIEAQGNKEFIVVNVPSVFRSFCLFILYYVKRISHSTHSPCVVKEDISSSVGFFDLCSKSI